MPSRRPARIAAATTPRAVPRSQSGGRSSRANATRLRAAANNHNRPAGNGLPRFARNDYASVIARCLPQPLPTTGESHGGGYTARGYRERRQQVIDAAAGEPAPAPLEYLSRVRVSALAQQILEEANAAVEHDPEDRDTAIAELKTTSRLCVSCARN